MATMDHPPLRGVTIKKKVLITQQMVSSKYFILENFSGILRRGKESVLLLLSACLVANVCLARGNRLFVGKETQKKVWFWEQIFGSYSSDYALIHDLNKPHLIIDVIHYNVRTAHDRDAQNQKIKQYLERYKLGIERFKNLQKKAILKGSIEKRLYEVYGQDRERLSNLFAGKVKVRSQIGLSDRFSEATKIAENYLPYMEKIFVSEGLPKELTRIAFVESMFQVNALSKVGARGVWQLMPGTARKYITVNRFIDERSSPIKATVAAAKFLRSNYEKLKSLPLAVASYNHGVYGILRAVKATGSKNLDVIVRNYESPSFKFASKNFYAEFIAAKNIYASKFLSGPHFQDNPLEIVEVDLPNKLAVSQLIRYTPLTETLIKRLNPCLQPLAFRKKYRTSPLLNGYSIFVPSRIAIQVKSKLKHIKL
ncbi:MAG: lytic transglycosylase domain-containing protein [Oligoflexales bacterium]